MSILNEIFEKKRESVAAAKARLPETLLETQALSRPVPPDFISALLDSTRPAPRLIAEVKRRSPSKGLLVPDFDPVNLAAIYARNGAAAISVLTDEPYFGGSLDDLQHVNASLEEPAMSEMDINALAGTRQSGPIPTLRKDFIFDRYQLLEARLAGASAVLLIAAMLSPAELAGLIAAAKALGLAPLVEVHTYPELETALNTGASLIGINNRDLHTFNVNLNTTLELMQHIPIGVTVVAESGIQTRSDVLRLGAAGVHAILVGEGIVTAPDRAAQVRLFAGCSDRMIVKICGIKTLENALAAAEAGAEMLGFNHFPGSKRYLTIEQCQAIQSGLRSQLSHPPAAVGVFVNASLTQIHAAIQTCKLDYAQLSGDEPLSELASLGTRAYKAIRPTGLAQAQEQIVSLPSRQAPPALLVDAYQPGEYGGTGVAADWSTARTLARQFPLLLAGGITPKNVHQAIQQVRPWGVDVASGVESSPGVQDSHRIRDFVQAALHPVSPVLL